MSNPPAYDRVTTISKFLALGMPLADVAAAFTLEQARGPGRPDLGVMKPGAAADRSILAVEDGQFPLGGVRGEVVVATRQIFARGAVVGGK
jgi:dihydroorotase